MEIFDQKNLPNWLGRYPAEYLRLVDMNIVLFAPWYLLDGKLCRLRFEGLQVRYPNRKLFAFAARRDNDDIACWEGGKDGKIIIVHDFSPEPRAMKAEYKSFWDWFRAAMEEMIAFE